LRIATLLLTGALAGAATAAWAQAQSPAQAPEQAPLLAPAAPPPAPAQRWSFKRVDDGFVRLDNKTGQVAHCTPARPGWTCQAVPEDRAALEKQVAELKAQVDSLKKEIAALRAAAAPPPPPPPAPKEGPAISLRMPTDAELARARDYVGDTLAASWHRLVQMIMHFQHDVLRKNG
jgi:hypothetical protein